MKPTANILVRDYILEVQPQERDFIGNFNPSITFKEVAARMRKGEDFYVICSCTESVEREIVFAALATIYKTNYDYWYYLWLKKSI